MWNLVLFLGTLLAVADEERKGLHQVPSRLSAESRLCFEEFSANLEVIYPLSGLPSTGHTSWSYDLGSDVERFAKMLKAADATAVSCEKSKFSFFDIGFPWFAYQSKLADAEWSGEDLDFDEEISRELEEIVSTLYTMFVNLYKLDFYLCAPPSCKDDMPLATEMYLGLLVGHERYRIVSSSSILKFLHLLPPIPVAKFSAQLVTPYSKLPIDFAVIGSSYCGTQAITTLLHRQDRVAFVRNGENDDLMYRIYCTTV